MGTHVVSKFGYRLGKFVMPDFLLSMYKQEMYIIFLLSVEIKNNGRLKIASFTFVIYLYNKKNCFLN